MMQDKKIITFHLLRFHLLPISSDEGQLNMFPEKVLSKSELIKRKNEFFREVLNEVGERVSDKFPIALHVKEDGYYVFKIANKKSVELYEDFKAVKYPTSPFAYIVINTDEEVQKIAISDNTSAFSSPSVVKNIIKKIFQRSEEHTSELQSRPHLVCRLLLEK